MDFILTEESKEFVKSKCKKLQMLAGLLITSESETLRLLGVEIGDISTDINDEMVSALPEHAE